MERSASQILENCYHCGNKGLLNIVGTYEQNLGGPIYDEYGRQVDYDLEEYRKFYLLQCPVCKNVTLFEKYSCVMIDPPVIESEILYPRNKISNDIEGVPSHIRSAFESALKVKNIDDSVCLLSLRRALEAICKDKNAEGNNLYEMTQDLVQKGIFPQGLEDACWIIRHLGNEAAHADEPSIHQIDVAKVIGFIDNIIDYTYSLPIRISKLKAQIERRDVFVEVDQCAEVTAE